MSKKIKVKNIKGKRLGPSKKNEFSAWFIPKDDLILKFNYSGHVVFFMEFFPHKTKSQDTELKEPDIKMNELKKYYDDIAEKIKSSNTGFFYARYSDFYDLGWIRFNYKNSTKLLTITYNKTARGSELQRLYEWIINENLNIRMVFIENTDSANSFTEYKYDEFKDKVFAKKASKQDTVSAVRNRMFGPGNYIYDDINSFDELFNLIMEELNAIGK
jgi:hypothetical protein